MVALLGVAIEGGEGLSGVATEGTASPGGMDIDAEAFGSVGRDGGSAGSAPATTIILPTTIVITIRGGATAGL